MPKSNWLVTLATAVAVVVLIVLPVVAVDAFMADDDAEAASIPDASSEERATSPGTSDPEMTQRRMQIHAETGPPEDFEPLQQRLHTENRAEHGVLQGRGTGQGKGLGQGLGPRGGQGQGTGGAGGGQGMGFDQEPGWLTEMSN